MTDALITTERLVLRPWSLDDAEEAFRLYGDAEVMRFIGPDRVHADVDATREQIGEILARIETLAPGQGSFPACSRETGEMVGTGLVKPLPDGDGHRTEHIEIGWHVRRDHWGRGLATEMGLALRDYAFEVLGLDVVHAVVDPANVASRTVARRVGLEERGLTRAWYGAELVHFGLTRADWRAREG